MKKNYRLDEIAEQFDVTRRTVERWVKSGEIESIKIGHTRRISGDALEKKSDNSRQMPSKSDIR